MCIVGVGIPSLNRLSLDVICYPSRDLFASHSTLITLTHCHLPMLRILYSLIFHFIPDRTYYASSESGHSAVRHVA
ncbi:hypothetical protein AG1IA_01021 [Rhizoctonia solani AG-1 IA]|uniref:Uncharacterized protein n=1 Tax=Thanatephorus cucumeris (strain AG1-IA) TaxID=983506 RepID=L8X404_THACA|nr:hypothetical protein AG1IA_01021 [Rhizoctonia solani AG-1 IA]